jgi:thiamine pyrophosphokinase
VKRCVIVAGADIRDYDLIRSYLQPADYFVYCDSGLAHMEALQAPADLIVGDFDSHPVPDLPAETIVLPEEKDDTDTVYAVNEALARGFEEFLLVGATGGRLDHTLGNLSILLKLDTLGKRALIVDELSEIEVVSDAPASVPDSFAYFSLLSVDGCARGVTVSDAKYPLVNADIDCEYPYGISNEVAPGEIAVVRVREGRLLLIRIRA